MMPQASSLHELSPWILTRPSAGSGDKLGLTLESVLFCSAGSPNPRWLCPQSRPHGMLRTVFRARKLLRAGVTGAGRDCCAPTRLSCDSSKEQMCLRKPSTHERKERKVSCGSTAAPNGWARGQPAGRGDRERRRNRPTGRAGLDHSRGEPRSKHRTRFGSWGRGETERGAMSGAPSGRDAEGQPSAARASLDCGHLACDSARTTRRDTHRTTFGWEKKRCDLKEARLWLTFHPKRNYSFFTHFCVTVGHTWAKSEKAVFSPQLHELLTHLPPVTL